MTRYLEQYENDQSEDVGGTRNKWFGSVNRVAFKTLGGYRKTTLIIIITKRILSVSNQDYELSFFILIIVGFFTN